MTPEEATARRILGKGKPIKPKPDEKGPLSRPLTPPEQEARKRAPKTKPFNPREQQEIRDSIKGGKVLDMPKPTMDMERPPRPRLPRPGNRPEMNRKIDLPEFRFTKGPGQQKRRTREPSEANMRNRAPRPPLTPPEQDAMRRNYAKAVKSGNNKNVDSLIDQLVGGQRMNNQYLNDLFKRRPLS